MQTIETSSSETNVPALKKRGTTVTLKDVARLAEVNPASVSMVINGSRSNSVVSSATRERILKAAAELGYVANSHAQRLAGARCHNLVQIFSLYPLQSYVSSILRQLQWDLRELGYDAPLHGYDNFSEAGQHGAVNQIRLLQELRQSKPRVIICHMSGLTSEAIEELEQFQEEGGVLLTFDHPSSLNCDQVILDEEETYYLAARHLLDLGHRDIGLIVIDYRSPAGSRRAGFERALREYGVEINEDWLWGGFPAEKIGEQVALQYLSLPPESRPSGLCIMDDFAALAFSATLVASGLQVPKEVSVIGHGNASIARFCPSPLTTQAFSVEELTNQLIHFLRQRLEDGYQGDGRQVKMSAELITRSSTKELV